MACSRACCFPGIVLAFLIYSFFNASLVQGHYYEDARVVLLHPLHREVVIVGHAPPLDPWAVRARVFGIQSALDQGLMLQIYVSSGKDAS